MPLFSSENWSGAGAASVVGILVAGGLLAFAVDRYAERLSDANLAQFMNRNEVAAADSVPIPTRNGRTGCRQSKKVLPSVAPLD